MTRQYPAPSYMLHPGVSLREEEEEEEEEEDCRTEANRLPNAS